MKKNKLDYIPKLTEIREGETIIGKWGKLGLLDGLTGHVKDNISHLYESKSSQTVVVEKTWIMVDMDGVIADFDKELKRLAPELELHDGEGYEERSKMVDKTCQENPGVFLRLGIEAVKLLAEKYEIRFLSTPMCELFESYGHKAEWLRKYFGDWAKKRLILTHDKHLVYGKYLIDDRLKNGSEKWKGEHIHFGTEKFPNWTSVLNYLL